MLNGEFRHEDSTGNKGDLGPGSVQWMTAAGGIIHSEMPIMKEGKITWISIMGKYASKTKNEQTFVSKY